MRRMLSLLVLAAGCAPAQTAAPIAPLAAPYKGWPEAIFMDAAEPGSSLIAVPESGGRIIHFARSGHSILFENPDYLGKTLANTKPDELAQGYIGYNIDLGPELRKIPKHLPLWMGPYGWRWDGASTHLLSSPDPSVGIQIEKTLKLDPKTGSLELLQTMTNVASAEHAYCLWDRTLCMGGGFALVPLAKKSRFKAGWSLMKDGAYRGEDPAHPKVRILDGVLVAQAEGPSSKLGLDSDAGWIAYARERLLFVKYFPYSPQGPYTDGGNSVEIYFDPKVCELEPLSPEVKLQPGERYAFPEHWILIELDHDVRRAEEARALVDRIPRSPLGR